MKIKLHILFLFTGILFAFTAHAQSPTLWGMTRFGGTNNVGTIFQTDTTGSAFKSDYSFHIQGASPFGNVIQANNGLLYGITDSGGETNMGTIFSYDIATNTYKDIYIFKGYPSDGQRPHGSLIQANNGLLYGMTVYGGSDDGGTIFSYNINTGVETDLYDFGSDTDGYYPMGSLLQANNGLLYGMTMAGGDNIINYDGGGIIFSYDISTNNYNLIYNFGGLYNFNSNNDGYNPYGALIQGGDGLLYGMTEFGGDYSAGTIFSYNITKDTEEVLYSFVVYGNPLGSLLQGKDSLLYGMTQFGGSYGDGTMFSYNIVKDTEIVLHSFIYNWDGQNPTGSLIQASNGLIYGMAESGGTYQINHDEEGTIFSYNTSADSFTLLYNFQQNGDGNYPYGSFIQASNGLLYSMTNAGGFYPYNSKGTLFSYNISLDTETVLFSLGNDTTDGQSPISSLIRANNGLLYGMTPSGGDSGATVINGGTIFSYDISTGKQTKLHDFGTGTDGYYPGGSLLQANNGLLYGMTSGGGSYNYGTIFSFNIYTNQETVVYNFGNGIDGQDPSGNLIQANNGLLYGMTVLGGINDSGTIFSYTISTGQETLLHSFGKNKDGVIPIGSLMQANDGLLYGLTQIGGSIDSGTIFSYNISTGEETVLHNFGKYSDGYYPEGSLLQANNGLLYGMTYLGGNTNYNYANFSGGIIFSYNISTGLEFVMHNFGNGTDGANPGSSLIQASNGLLYGTTSLGGTGYVPGGKGTIFSFDISKGVDSVIYNFTGLDGAGPEGDLLEVDSPFVATSIKQISVNNTQVSIYPNPTTGNFTIQLQNINQNTRIEIFNVLGEKIYTANLNSTNTPINLSNHTAGIYLYRVLDEQGNQIGSGKFIIE